MNWDIKITRTANGYVVEFGTEFVDDKGPIAQQAVFEDEGEWECKCPGTSCLVSARNMLLFVKEQLGVLRSKHNNKNLEIEIRQSGGMDSFNYQDILEAMKSGMLQEGATNEDVAKEVERQIKNIIEGVVEE